ncbi:hypothetical protein ACFWMG_04875 [Streptomyces sp. NPDC127074]|uniref:hypothetical protein n=1 Tax=Streptomyces sp. NPDC127074 TaxID=3347130 RepID=UPI0036666320
MAAIGGDPKPESPEEEAARKKRVAALIQQAAEDYRIGFGRPKAESQKALAA